MKVYFCSTLFKPLINEFVLDMFDFNNFRPVKEFRMKTSSMLIFKLNGII